MKTVSLQEAIRDLDTLAHAVEQGEVVTVTRDGKPVLDLVPHAGAVETVEEKPKTGGIDWEAGEAYLRSRGIVRGPGFIADDFDDPLPEDFLLRPLP